MRILILAELVSVAVLQERVSGLAVEENLRSRLIGWIQATGPTALE